ncbi:TetR/AcrR family transcriptional regulator [Halomonas denitrificans]|uniref:TetR/AcrR family transcriptional regulator n=1 Tax=Halomonas TaxID=2745 RepID=UPI001C9386AF|nr:MULTISPECIES: TetR/AcrR family transcriptional regulator [Halomonas]MED5293950.1 TetR/AcrR family transcriptional regulator [Pseudomonadota bacterium]MBY5926340.1 TetR/AcrR family transcriptional regulator [Halomonas sp. DP4Y7-2]MBY5930007.1 TetR/AcrR family transcriptional regulator [Halomonas sp. DP8Y7-3]MBY6030142.1 TetR/AcrR family transcriptional regulator [Halomonas sp. DP8Y7-1]MBY6209753.1 TetR/AcrR family transcriptional regulator [Halomonas sp. DP3Y7-2]
MRPRDDSKRVGLLEATLVEVTEHGFQVASVARIARRAKVSPATVYIHFTDKTALLEATFVHVCDRLIDTALEAFDDEVDLRAGLKAIWRALFGLALEQPRLFRFHDAFSHSVWMTEALRERNDRRLSPLLDVVDQGQRSGVLKPAGRALVHCFLFLPIYQLVHGQQCHPFDPSDANIELAFAMAWDAIAASPEAATQGCR